MRNSSLRKTCLCCFDEVGCKCCVYGGWLGASWVEAFEGKHIFTSYKNKRCLDTLPWTSLLWYIRDLTSFYKRAWLWWEVCLRSRQECLFCRKPQSSDMDIYFIMHHTLFLSMLLLHICCVLHHLSSSISTCVNGPFHLKVLSPTTLVHCSWTTPTPRSSLSIYDLIIDPV